MNSEIRTTLRKIKNNLDPLAVPFYKMRRKPFSLGYNTYKWKEIANAIQNDKTLSMFKKGQIPANFGIKIDERVAEYPWIFSRLPEDAKSVLDAGSTFNFKEITSHKYFQNKKLNIFTFHPELNNFSSDRVSYEYGDLRKMEYEDASFDVVVSHSTIEHIDMDNNIYGYDIAKNENIRQKSYDYMLAVNEMERVLKSGGKFLLTFPYGVFKHYGFFQQFDVEMVDKIEKALSANGEVKKEFILYHENGWQFAEQKDCNNSLSFNPHTGEGKGDDGAAHCRCVCLIEFNKF